LGPPAKKSEGGSGPKGAGGGERGGGGNPRGGGPPRGGVGRGGARAKRGGEPRGGGGGGGENARGDFKFAFSRPFPRGAIKGRGPFAGGAAKKTYPPLKAPEKAGASSAFAWGEPGGRDGKRGRGGRRPVAAFGPPREHPPKPEGGPFAGGPGFRPKARKLGGGKNPIQRAVRRPSFPAGGPIFWGPEGPPEGRHRCRGGGGGGGGDGIFSGPGGGRGKKKKMPGVFFFPPRGGGGRFSEKTKNGGGPQGGRGGTAARKPGSAPKGKWAPSALFPPPPTRAPEKIRRGIKKKSGGNRWVGTFGEGHAAREKAKSRGGRIGSGFFTPVSDGGAVLGPAGKNRGTGGAGGGFWGRGGRWGPPASPPPLKKPKSGGETSGNGAEGVGGGAPV